MFARQMHVLVKILFLCPLSTKTIRELPEEGPGRRIRLGDRCVHIPNFGIFRPPQDIA